MFTYQLIFQIHLLYNYINVQYTFFKTKKEEIPVLIENTPYSY